MNGQIGKAHYKRSKVTCAEDKCWSWYVGLWFKNKQRMLAKYMNTKCRHTFQENNIIIILTHNWSNCVTQVSRKVGYVSGSCAELTPNTTQALTSRVRTNEFQQFIYICMWSQLALRYTYGSLSEQHVGRCYYGLSSCNLTKKATKKLINQKQISKRTRRLISGFMCHVAARS